MHAFYSEAIEPPLIMDGYTPLLEEVSATAPITKHWYQCHYRDRHSARFYYVHTEFADGTIGNWTDAPASIGGSR